MSLFETIEVSCPRCGTPRRFEAVLSVNADRRPDLADAIVHRSFQRETCESCEASFRVDPEFSYIHVERGQWIAVFPIRARDSWEAHEARSQALYARSFGSVPKLAKNLRPRVCFGWSAIREKIVIARAGADDVEVELLKSVLLHRIPEISLSADVELRVVEFTDDQVIVARIDAFQDALIDAFEVPRGELGALKEESVGGLRASLTRGMWVDFMRLLLMEG